MLTEKRKAEEECLKMMLSMIPCPLPFPVFVFPAPNSSYHCFDLKNLMQKKCVESPLCVMWFETRISIGKNKTGMGIRRGIRLNRIRSRNERKEIEMNNLMEHNDKTTHKHSLVTYRPNLHMQILFSRFVRMLTQHCLTSEFTSFCQKFSAYGITFCVEASPW